MCYNCRQAGHEIADCPEIRKDHDQGAGICFKCGSTEHRLEKCRTRTPNGMTKINGYLLYFSLG